MNNSNFDYYKNSLIKHDLKAGISVFLVALPLCLGIALASGAPLFSGLLAGIVAGIVVSMLSGSEISVSGPAAGLTVIVAQAILKIGSFEGFLVAVMLAGALQFLMGYFKLGRLGAYFPQSVIKGMLVAIGLVIIFKQIPHALGDDQDFEGEFEFNQTADNENTITEIIKSVVDFNEGALIISFVCLLVLIFWEKAAKKNIGFFKLFPSSLVVVLLGVALNEFFKGSFPTLYLGDSTKHMVNIPQINSIAEAKNVLNFPDFAFLANLNIYTVALSLAIVASLETLLNLEAADAIDPQKRLSSPDQELKAQGIGNLISGLVGGLPITSVVVRTSANVYNGGQTRMSAFVHGCLLLLSVLLIPQLLNRIPLSALAAILLMLGWKLANYKTILKVYQEGKNQFIPFIITVLVVVFEDLLIGIFVGTAVGLLFVVFTNFSSTITVIRDEHRVLITFNKDISFLQKPRLKQELAQIKSGDYLYVDATRADFIDHDILLMLEAFKESAELKNIETDYKSVRKNQKNTRKNLDPSIN